MRVPSADRGRYRNCKGQISVNVLGVCDINMNFIYVLSGGSEADSRVLRDAISRQNGLKIPNGMQLIIEICFRNVYANIPNILRSCSLQFQVTTTSLIAVIPMVPVA